MFGRVTANLGGRASARHARAFFYSYHRMNTHQRRNFTLNLADHHSRVTWSDAIIFAVLAFGGMLSLCATMLANVATRSNAADVDETFYQLWKVMRDPSKRFEFERAHRAELAYPDLKDQIGEIDHPEGSTVYVLPELTIPDDLAELRSRRNKEALREAQQNLKSVNEKKILSAAGIDRNLLDKAISNPTQLTSSQVERLKKGLVAVQVARKLAGNDQHLYRDASFSSFRTQARSVKEALSEDSVQGLGVLARTFGVRVKDADKALADLARQDKELAAAVEEVVPVLKSKYDLIAPGKEEFEAYRTFWQNYLNKAQGGVLAITKKDGKSIPTLLEGVALTGYLSDYATRIFAPQAQDPFYAVGLSVFNRGADAQLATDLANADGLYSQLAAKVLGSGYDTRVRTSSPLA